MSSAECAGEMDDISDTIDVRLWAENEPVTFGELSVVARRMNHPPEAYGFRITGADGRVLVYTGDTGMCDNVVELARGADVLLSEASWTDSPDRPEESISPARKPPCGCARRRQGTSPHPHPAVDIA
ncbi:hypothetical protein GCM10020255_092810 [Rhodococcus baikonurensis]